MCRRYLSSSIGTQRLVAEGKTRPPAPKPDANSSDELIRGHFDKLGFGIQPVETTIRWDRIECLHQSRCENCQQLRTCPYQRWFMTGRHGYQPIRDPRLQLIPLRPARWGDPPNYTSFTAYGKYATEEWRKLLDSGAVVEVTREEAANSPVEPCRLGIVLKGRDVFEACQAGIHLVDEQSVSTWDRMRRTRGLDAIKKRLICDASVNGYNRSLATVPFTATARSALEALMFKGCWMATTDLSSFYTQSRFAHDVRKQLHVRVGEKCYGFVCCNFGTATLPWYCGILSAFLAEEIRARGIPVAFYVDDFVIVAASEEEAKRYIELVNQIAEELGLPVARHKVKVAQRLTYLGIVFDSLSMTMNIDPDVAQSKHQELQEKFVPWIRRGLCDQDGRPQILRLDSLIGTLGWFSEVLQSGRTRLGGLYVLQKYGLDTNRNVRQRVTTDLEWWMSRLDNWRRGAVEAQTMPIIDAREYVEGVNRRMVIVQTDASGPDGRGGYHGTYSGETATYWSRTWTTQELPLRENSHAAELQALSDFVETYDKHEQLVLWVTDSASAAYSVLKGYTGDMAALPILRRIMALADEKQLVITALWVPRGRNIIADYLSHAASDANLTSSSILSGTLRMG